MRGPSIRFRICRTNDSGPQVGPKDYISALVLSTRGSDVCAQGLVLPLPAFAYVITYWKVKQPRSCIRAVLDKGPWNEQESELQSFLRLANRKRTFILARPTDKIDSAHPITACIRPLPTRLTWVCEWCSHGQATVPYIGHWAFALRPKRRPATQSCSRSPWLGGNIYRCIIIASQYLKFDKRIMDTSR